MRLTLLKTLCAIGLLSANLTSLAKAVRKTPLAEAVRQKPLAEALPKTHSSKNLLSIEAIELGAGLDSAQPNVVAEPQSGGFILSWQQRQPDGCHALKLMTIALDNNSGAADLGAHVRAASGCDWFVNWADFPGVAVADNGDWQSFYLQKSAASPYAYDIHTIRSRDRGKHFDPPVKLHQDGTQTEHGFVSLVPHGKDEVLAVWLDGRGAQQASDAAHAHDAHGENEMSLRSAVIARAGKVRLEREIDARVCSCCATDVARIGVNPQAHQVVFRDRSADEIRDTGTALWHQQRWQHHATVFPDQWKIEGCPVNGPALGVQRGAQLVAWSTMTDGPLEVRVKLQHSDAKPVILESSETALGRVDVAPWGESEWLVSWLGAAPGEQTALNVAVLDQTLSLKAKQVVAVLPAGRNIGMPKLASVNGNQALLVWTAADTTSPKPRPQIKAVQIRLR